MTAKLERLSKAIGAALGGRIVSQTAAFGELTVVVDAADLLSAASILRDSPMLGFEQLIDLCGVDYSTYGDGAWEGRRFAVVVHLLSVTHNWRVRLRTFAADDAFPIVDSLVDIWPSVNWFEREAFDLFGIVFTGHPFRKDFPLSGQVEMRYDPEQKRVIYQPVSIEPREITPRIIREESYGKPGRG